MRLVLLRGTKFPDLFPLQPEEEEEDDDNTENDWRCLCETPAKLQPREAAKENRKKFADAARGFAGEDGRSSLMPVICGPSFNIWARVLKGLGSESCNSPID